MATPKEKKDRKTLSIKAGEQRPGGPPKEAPHPPEPHHEPEVTASVLNDEQSDMRAVTARVEDIFKAVGTDQLPDTIMPRAKNRNNADQAAEYVLARYLRDLANNRFKQAEEDADKAGVFGDKEEYIEGQTVQVYTSPHYTVSVKMGKATKMVNKEAVEAKLIDVLGASKGSEALEECLKERAPAKQIIVSLK